MFRRQMRSVFSRREVQQAMARSRWAGTQPQRLQRAGQVIEQLVDLQQTAGTVMQEIVADTGAVPAKTMAAIKRLHEKIEHTVEFGHQANVQGKRSILIIDDDPLLRNICSANLEASGFRVLEAGDAFEGMRLLESEEVNLVLMDLMLPGMDGIAATRRIRACEQHQMVPIVILTGNSDPETVKTCASAGAVGFIVKPIDPIRFVNKIRKHLGTA